MTLKRGNPELANLSDEELVREQRQRVAQRRARKGGHGHSHHPGLLPSEKAKDFKGTLLALLRFMMRYKGRLILIIVAAIAAALFSIIGPKVLSEATTVLFNGIVAKVAGTGSIDFGLIATILATTLGIYVFSALASFMQGWLMTYLSQHTCYDLRRAIAGKINRLPFGFFEGSSTGDTLSRITNDVDTLGQSLNQGVTQVFTAVTTLIGVLVMMLSINWIMTLIALAMIPISALLVAVVVKHSQKYFFAQQANLGAINGEVEETFSGHSIVKAFGREEATIEAFDEMNQRLYEAGWKSQFFSGLMHPIMNFVSDLGYVAVAITGAFFAANSIITVGDIQAFIQYVRNFTQPITQLTQVANVLQQMVAAAERIFVFLEQEEETPSKTTTKTVAPLAQSEEESTLEGATVPMLEMPTDEHLPDIMVRPAALCSQVAVKESDLGSPCQGLVEFKDLCFGYDPAHPVINHFSARIEPGQTVAIVGPTGAGKTTIVKLLMRFYEPQTGSIAIDGVDIQKLERDEVRKHFAMVLQDTWLFSGTIRENIVYGATDADDAAIQNAARQACADGFIQSLPGAYDFVINEDASNISQGQRQLLTIARALLANRSMLILDEATSSVDTRTEARIQRAMDNLMRGRTAFVIAHRLSTIRSADLILVMDKGAIVESGTHEQLLAVGGFYASLYNSQFVDGASADGVH